MYNMNYKSKNFLSLFAIAAASVCFSGCSDETVLQDPGNTVTNTGTISHANFSVLVSDVAPTVIDPMTNVFTKTDVEVTVFIGDRRNQVLTDSHTIFFATEYGLIEPSCVTSEGFCTVTWSAIKRPVVGGPGDDGDTTIVAYTTGEEAFSDNNGNNLFDDGDTFSNTDDLEEPFVDFNDNGSFDSNADIIIDTVNGNDLTGSNGVHDINDGFFNGGGCTHSSLCSTVVTSPVIWDAVEIRLTGP